MVGKTKIKKQVRRTAEKRGITRACAEVLEQRQLLASNLVSVTGAQDLIFDSTGNELYITTSSGKLQRYDIASHTLLPSWAIGSDLRGGDITADGKCLYIADYGSKVIRKVELTSGVVTSLAYGTDNPGGRPYDLQILSNGKAYFSFSEWGKLQQIDLVTWKTETVSSSDSMWGTCLVHSPDGDKLFYLDGYGDLGFYDGLSNAFTSSRETDTLCGTNSVNHDGTLYAARKHLGSGVAILNHNLEFVRTLNDISGGFTFDSTRNIFYGVDAATDQVIAYDTNTWQEKYRLNIGEDVKTSSGGFGTGTMSVSADGTLLFLVTSSGIRILDLPQSDGKPVSEQIEGFQS